MSFSAAGYLLALALLAHQAHARVPLLRSFVGWPGWLFSLALTQFVVAWADFLAYLAFGWGPIYLTVVWLLVLGPLSWLATRHRPADSPAHDALTFRARLGRQLRTHAWFLGLALFVIARFYAGLDEDQEGQIWVVFNFVDTAFHLSVANAFLESPRFPPLDFDFPPFALKYHFLADFSLAHLIQLGTAPLRAIWLLNLVNAAALVGSVWAVFTRWLRLPARWIMFAGFVFLFLNTTVVNLLHYLLLKPAYFDATRPFTGILRYPYFNFESLLTNLLEPQRALLFTLPALLFGLHLLFGDRSPTGPDPATDRRRTLLALGLICLLPFAHIVGFAVLALCAAPSALRHRHWLLHRVFWWLPATGLLAFQLIYLFRFGPPTHAQFSGWDVVHSLPLDEFRAVPALFRRAVFWFFVNGDFFGWSAVLAGLAWWRRRSSSARAAGGAFRLGKFLRDWHWYLVVCGGVFLLINFYRYSRAWGDSNKFVLFLNLGLTLIITLGCAQWRTGSRRWISHALWILLLLLCAVPPGIVFVRRVFLYPTQNNLFFHRHEINAAAWLRQAAGPGDYVLTAAFTDSHFVSALAAQPSVAGIYADSNPNWFPGRKFAARQVFEEDALPLLEPLRARYICISRHERRVYRLAPIWLDRMRAGTGVVFHAGEPGEFESVYLFDTFALRPPASRGP